MTETTKIFDLETQLADDADGTLLREIKDSLTTEFSEVRRHIDAGVTPEEFKSFNEYSAALQAANNVLEKVWKNEHKR